MGQRGRINWGKWILIAVAAIILIYVIYQNYYVDDPDFVSDGNNSNSAIYPVNDSKIAVKSTVTDIYPADAKKLIDGNDNLIVIDVSAGFSYGHIPGAINYYIGDGSFDDALETLDKNKPYLIYSRTDSEASSAAKKMIDAGFSRVYRLRGGYSLWIEQGYDFSKD